MLLSLAYILAMQEKTLRNSVLKLTLVDGLSILRRQYKDVEGTRQISSVTLEEGVPVVAAINGGRRLFLKNTGLCKIAR